jgi:PAS domain S-box-containing protein
MRFRTLSARLVTTIGLPLLLLEAVTFFVATSHLTTIIDQSQNEVYEQKLRTIIGILDAKYQRLLATGMIEAYEDFMKESAVKTIRDTYGTGESAEAVPFIIDDAGKVILHPLSHGDHPVPVHSELIQRVLETRDGDYDTRSPSGRMRWYIVRHFPHWNWVVGYIIPHSVKYADVIRFRQVFLPVIGLLTLLVLLVVVIIISAATKPIRSLTVAADAIASGNLDRGIDLATLPGNEIGLLGHSFSRMRDSLKERMGDLARKNRQLKREIDKRTSAERRLRTIIQNMPVMMYARDQDGTVVAWNAECENVTGYTEEEIACLPDAAEVLFDDHTHPAASGTSPNDFRNLEKAIRCKDGSTRIILWSDISARFPVPGWNSWIVGLDITGPKHLEEQLRQSDKLRAIGQLAGGIAHDFNNQLTGIQGYADLILNRSGHEPSVRSYAENIITSVQRAAGITAQLLAYSRKGKYRNEPVDIHELLTEVIDLLSHTIDKRIVVDHAFDGESAMTVGDGSQLQNAFLNIALNARDAMPSGGRFTIRTDTCTFTAAERDARSLRIEPGEYCRVSFVDTGTGMDAETMSHIFEPFYTTKERGKGTGMGLSAVFGTILNHTGDITVESTPGSGSTFTVYLPLHRSTTSPAAADTSPRPNHTPTGTILLVDDEPTVCDAVSKALRACGYEVVCRHNGAEGVAYYRDAWRSVDLVILDVVMPVMNGTDALHALQAINADVKAIFASGYSVDLDETRLLSLGAARCIHKPFRMEALLKTLAEVLSG